MFDVIIVGSGPAGVNAAYPLIHAGLNVAIIDGGLDSKKKETLSTLIQSKYSSNAYDLLRKSSYVFNKTYEYLKVKSQIEIVQSLAKGGLSEIWHGICDYLSPSELKQIGLPVKEILAEYKEVAKRVRLTNRLQLDNHSTLLIKASQNNTHMTSTVYPISLAMKYRTSSFIEDFKHHKNFTYLPGQLVKTVKDKKTFVNIASFSIETKEESTYQSKYVILAAGSINTTRILLRSLNLFNYKTTFFAKAQYIIVCLHPRIIFRNKRRVSPQKHKKSRIGQIAMYSNKTHHGVGEFFIQLYRFNPAAISKALKYIPLPKFMTLPMVSILAPSILIADVRFPAFESKKKNISLKKIRDGYDILEISFKHSRNELHHYKLELGKIAKQLRSLGLFQCKVMNPLTTPHYAGGVPITSSPQRLSADKNGKLHQAKRIYIADSSTWRLLPAKPPTLTIMANASRVGKIVLRKFPPVSV